MVSQKPEQEKQVIAFQHHLILANLSVKITIIKTDSYILPYYRQSKLDKCCVPPYNNSVI